MCTCQLNIWRLAKGGHMQKRHKIHLSYNTTHHSLDPSIICILYKMLWISEPSPFVSCHPKIQICQLHCQADDSLVSRVQILICTSWPFRPLSNVRTEQRQDRIRQNPDQREGWHSPAPASIRTLTSLQCSDGRQQAARRRSAHIVLPTNEMNEPKAGMKDATTVRMATTRMRLECRPSHSAPGTLWESFWKHPLDLNLVSTISWIGCIITGNVNASAMHRPTCQLISDC